MRIEDALAATRAAVEEGIVPGGGVALLNVTAKVRDLAVRPRPAMSRPAYHIVLQALEEPIRQIAATAASTAASSSRRSRRSEQAGYGYDVLKGDYVDMIERGIIDPTKVTRSALQNAASVAAMVLTTESPGHRYPRARTRGARRRPAAAWAACTEEYRARRKERGPPGPLFDAHRLKKLSAFQAPLPCAVPCSAAHYRPSWRQAR